ncbi:unnamed protein product [Boreogadus saida]
MATASRKHADFVSQPMGTKMSDALPGIGDALGSRLAERGFERAYMVLGRYLVLGRDKVRFNRWLHETCRANEEQQRDCHRAIQEWCNSNV